MIKSLLVGMYVLSLQVCPDPSALETFKHQIAYEMTEELRPFEGLVSMHTDVWMQGPITVFYVRDQARGFAPNERPLSSALMKSAQVVVGESGWRWEQDLEDE